MKTLVIPTNHPNRAVEISVSELGNTLWTYNGTTTDWKNLTNDEVKQVIRMVAPDYATAQALIKKLGLN